MFSSMTADVSVYRKMLVVATLLVASTLAFSSEANAHGFGSASFGYGGGTGFGYGGGFNSFAMPYNDCDFGAAGFGGYGAGVSAFGYGRGFNSFAAPYSRGFNSFRTFNSYPTNRVFVASGFNRPFVAGNFAFGRSRGFGNRGFSAGFSFGR